MKNFIIYLGILIMAATIKVFGQESFEHRAKIIALQIEKITQEEKVALKEKIAAVNTQLEQGKLTREQADEEKLKYAQESAKIIEERVLVEQDKLTILVKEKVDGQIALTDTSSAKKKITINWNKKKDKIFGNEKRNITEFVFAMGLNNVVTNGAVANSDFRYYGSHFYEVGLMMNSRLLKSNNLYHLRYGLTLQYNNLRPTDNRQFVEVNQNTELQNAPFELKDSRFKNVNLVAPVYFEFDFSKNKKIVGKEFFRTHQGIRVGFGGHIGLNVSSKQYLEFEQNGHDFSQTECGNFNTNKWVYGVGCYIGHEDMSLYLKYDLNPVFTAKPCKAK